MVAVAWSTSGLKVYTHRDGSAKVCESCCAEISIPDGGWSDYYCYACGGQDNIDVGDAVDKGDGRVGIPVTGHGCMIGSFIRFYGTTFYDGAYEVESGTTTNELVITETYNAESFDGSELASCGTRIPNYITVTPSGITDCDCCQISGQLYYNGMSYNTVANYNDIDWCVPYSSHSVSGDEYGCVFSKTWSTWPSPWFSFYNTHENADCTGDNYGNTWVFSVTISVGFYYARAGANQGKYRTITTISHLYGYSLAGPITVFSHDSGYVLGELTNCWKGESFNSDYTSERCNAGPVTATVARGTPCYGGSCQLTEGGTP